VHAKVRLVYTTKCIDGHNLTWSKSGAAVS